MLSYEKTGSRYEKDAEDYYKMVISNIFVLSYALTYSNQLSPASFWLAVYLTADRPTMHRKFWRISSFRELWAMKRILSLHSRKELRFATFPLVSFCILAFS